MFYLSKILLWFTSICDLVCSSSSMIILKSSTDSVYFIGQYFASFFFMLLKLVIWNWMLWHEYLTLSLFIWNIYMCYFWILLRQVCSLHGFKYCTAFVFTFWMSTTSWFVFHYILSLLLLLLFVWNVITLVIIYIWLDIFG
jgi:hypothetical protein